MRRARWFRNKLFGVLALAVALALALTSCSLFETPQEATDAGPTASPTSSAVPEVAAVEVSFPGRDDLQSVTEAVEQTPEMVEAAPAEVSGPVDISLVEGRFPDSGAVVTFELDEKVDELSAPVIAHWNEETTEWAVQPTTLADDGMSVSATVQHFSIFAVTEDIYNAVNKVVGNFAERPKCPRDPPAWAETTFLDDQNGPVLWCVVVDEKNPDILEVRMVANRSSAMMVSTAVEPEWAYSDVFGDTGPGTWFATAFGGATLEAGTTNRYLIPPKGEYRFGFTKDDLFEFWRTAQGRPLIQADVSSGTAVVGLIYGAAAESASPVVAGAITAITVAECGHGIYNAGKDRTFSSVTSTVTGCISDRKDVIAGLVAEEVMAKDSVSWQEATKAATASGSRIGFALGIYTLSKAHLTLGSLIGDMLIDPAAFQLYFNPSTELIPDRLGPGPGESIDDLYGSGCTAGGEATIEHPTWGQIRIVTFTGADLSQPSVIAAVDDADKVLWSAEIAGLTLLKPAPNAQDSTGNVFLNSNAGRYNGVIVLKPIAEGFDDLGSIPTGDDQGRFFFSSIDEGQGGKAALWDFDQDCTPSCAAGTITKERLEWDGSGYVPAGPIQVAVWPDEDYVSPS